MSRRGNTGGMFAARKLYTSSAASKTALLAARPRSYATESAEYRHHNTSAPPPPAPKLERPLPEAASPSIISSTVSSPTSSTPASRLTASLSGTGKQPLQPLVYDHDLPLDFGKNQKDASDISIDPELQNDLEAIMSDFRAPIRYAFAYGSGVFKQAGYSKTAKPMLDFVFAVSHPDHWHSINVNQHKDHYSLMARIFGSRVISILQERVGASVWFNVECLVQGRIIKYGVISVDAMVKDLLDWETLYIAGRMHKPVHVLRDEPRIRLASQVNLSSAVRAALLLLPETFSEEDLYREITALSYRGDFRMQVGENPNKIKNIVSTQAEHFQKLYKPILQSFHKHISFMGPEGSGSIRQDINPKAKADIARRLPLRLREMLLGQYERDVNILTALGKTIDFKRAEDQEEKVKLSDETARWRSIASRGNFQAALDKCIQMTVARPAFSQSMKGIASVGPIRGIRYVWPKLKKKWAPSE